MQDNAPTTKYNIIAGILFLGYAFIQLFQNGLDSFWIFEVILKSPSTIVIMVTSLTVAIFCFMARKNMILVLITGFFSIGMLIVNCVGYRLGFRGVLYGLPSLIVFLGAMLSLKGILQENKLLERLIWIIPLVLILPIYYGWVGAVYLSWITVWCLLYSILYGTACSALALWYIKTPNVIIINDSYESQTNTANCVPAVKYCSTCGTEIHINAVICPNCGCAVK